MATLKRDDFSKGIREALALRAGHRCSFDGCHQITAGPSAESAEAVARIGHAAHISAAAPGGKRYNAGLSRQERSNIANGIWLCATHATLIDQDETAYTPEILLAMKSRHEKRIVSAMKEGDAVKRSSGRLVEIGWDTVCSATFREASEASWVFKVEDFVRGDRNTLLAFCDRFKQLPDQGRHVLSDELGDGRVLSAAPSWKAEANTLTITCPVQPRSARIPAQELGKSLKLNLDGDLAIEGRHLTFVKGVDALPQRILTALSTIKGESSSDRSSGTRLSEYRDLFCETPWFNRFCALEVIRAASIPMKHDPKEMTPLYCVERVLSFELAGSFKKNDRAPVRLVLEVKGLGLWTETIEILIPSNIGLAASRDQEYARIR